MQIRLVLTAPLLAHASRMEVPRRETARIDCDDSDGQLVRRALNGNRWAEEALYHRHVREVMRVVLRLLARTSEAEDVVQDVFELGLRDLSKLQNPDAFKPWLMSIAVHQVHRRFRRRNMLRMLGLDRSPDDVSLAEQADPRAGPDVHATLIEIDQLLKSLPARARIAWVLRYVEDQKLDDIAVVCNCSRTTVKRLLASADLVLGDYVTPAADEANHE